MKYRNMLQDPPEDETRLLVEAPQKNEITAMHWKYDVLFSYEEGESFSEWPKNYINWG